ncbi:MAG TPA: PA14 domain-containing protein [bacterium]|nr:PA14 domain-containing protein [bacterium]
MKRPVSILGLALFLLAGNPARSASPDLALVLQKMSRLKDVRFFVTPTLYDQLTPEDLQAFGRGQVRRLEAPFDLWPNYSKLYWRTGFLLDPGKRASLQLLKDIMDYNKQTNRRPQPEEEWKNGKGETVAYFYPIRNVDVHQQRGFWAFYDTLKDPDRLSETLTAWFHPPQAGVYQFFIQGGPVTLQVDRKTVRDRDKLDLEVNDYPILIYSTCPYDPKGKKKYDWPKSTETFQGPDGKVRALDEGCLKSYGFFCGVEGTFYPTPDLKGPPTARHQVAFLDVTSEGDLGAPGPVLSASWKGEFDAEEEGSYSFRVQSSDPVSLTIDGKRVLTAPGTTEGKMALKAGPHRLAMVWRRKLGDKAPPQLHLLWKGPKAADHKLFLMVKKSFNYS